MGVISDEFFEISYGAKFGRLNYYYDICVTTIA